MIRNYRVSMDFQLPVGLGPLLDKRFLEVIGQAAAEYIQKLIDQASGGDGGPEGAPALADPPVAGTDSTDESGGKGRFNALIQEALGDTCVNAGDTEIFCEAILGLSDSVAKGLPADSANRVFQLLVGVSHLPKKAKQAILDVFDDGPFGTGDPGPDLPGVTNGGHAKSTAPKPDEARSVEELIDALRRDVQEPATNDPWGVWKGAPWDGTRILPVNPNGVPTWPVQPRIYMQTVCRSN